MAVSWRMRWLGVLLAAALLGGCLGAEDSPDPDQAAATSLTPPPALVKAGDTENVSSNAAAYQELVAKTAKVEPGDALFIDAWNLTVFRIELTEETFWGTGGGSYDVDGPAAMIFYREETDLGGTPCGSMDREVFRSFTPGMGGGGISGTYPAGIFRIVAIGVEFKLGDDNGPKVRPEGVAFEDTSASFDAPGWATADGDGTSGSFEVAVGIEAPAFVFAEATARPSVAAGQSRIHGEIGGESVCVERSHSPAVGGAVVPVYTFNSAWVVGAQAWIAQPGGYWWRGGYEWTQAYEVDTEVAVLSVPIPPF